MLLSRVFCRSFSTGSVKYAINHVTVIGGGLMGAGIAQITAQSGLNVTMVDVNESLLRGSKKRIEKSLDRILKKKYTDKPEEGGKILQDTMSRIQSSLDAITTVKQTDLVIEAIVENIQTKQKLFKSLDDSAPQSTIFVSNTSSLPISEISSVCSQERLKNFGGLHFFNPVPIMKLVEVIKISHTSDETCNMLNEFCVKVGKISVQAKDTPGFIVNRLLVPYMMNAIKMLERGDASATDIDTAMKLGAGYPMGPLELSDYVGLDTMKFIMDGWNARFEDAEFQPSQLLNKLIQEGKYGVKSGEGFYKYNKR